MVIEINHSAFQARFAPVGSGLMKRESVRAIILGQTVKGIRRSRYHLAKQEKGQATDTGFRFQI